MGEHPNLSLYSGMAFPQKIPDNYFEPNGVEYGKYKEWESIEAEIATLSSDN